MKKVRVYEYAKEIGKQSKDIIKVLRESEIEVSNHMSMLTEEGLAKLDSIFKAKKEEPKAEKVASNQNQSDTKKHKKKKIKKKKIKNLINSSLQLLKHLQKKQFQKTLS